MQFYGKRKIDPEGIELAGRMRALRLELGRTQADFAFHFKVSLRTYSRWEVSGPPRSPPIRDFCKLKMSWIKQRHRAYQKQLRRRARGKKG